LTNKQWQMTLKVTCHCLLVLKIIAQPLTAQILEATGPGFLMGAAALFALGSCESVGFAGKVAFTC